jgi:hypothetical protein
MIMKKTIAILILWNSCLCGYSQNHASNIDDIVLSPLGISFALDTKMAVLGQEVNSALKVLDSTDYYTGNYELWDFESRFKSLSFDHYGNVLYGASKIFKNNIWTDKYKIYYTYSDPLNNIRDTYRKQIWDAPNNRWLDGSYTKYYINGGYTEMYVKDWDYRRSVFKSGERIVFNLNPQGLSADRLVQKWDTVSNDWRNDSYFTYTYSSINKPSEINLSIWDKISSQWVLSRRDNIVYDQAGNNQRQTIQYRSFYLGWINGYQLDSYYNVNLDSVISKKWNEVNQRWDTTQKNTYSFINNLVNEVIVKRKAINSGKFINYQKIIYNYNKKGAQTLYLIQFWDDIQNAWINFDQLINVYDPRGNKTEVLQQKWDITGAYWKNVFRESYTYVQNDLNSSYTRQIWDDELDRWINVEKRVNYFSNFNSRPEILTSKSSEDLQYFFLYPNPASDFVNIRFNENHKPGYGRIDLIDSNGRMVKSYEYNGEDIFVIQREGLRSGRYYINFTGDKIFSSKVIFE